MAAPPDERKERVIHARVPESLDDEIRKRAGNLGVSVSNLVRNILQNTVGLVESIVADSAEIARSAREVGGRPQRPVGDGPVGDGPVGDRPVGDRPGAPAPRVLGWQQARLAVNALCERCNAILPRGSDAAIGIVQAGGAPLFRCIACSAETGSSAGGEDGRA